MYLKINLEYNYFPFCSHVLLHRQQGKYHNYLTKLICTQGKLRGILFGHLILTILCCGLSKTIIISPHTRAEQVPLADTYFLPHEY